MVSNLVDGFVPFLIEWGVKGTVVLAAGGLVCALMRRRRAAERHALWAAVLAGVLIVPLLGLVLPGFHVPEWPVAIADIPLPPVVANQPIESFVFSPPEPVRVVEPAAMAPSVTELKSLSLDLSFVMFLAWGLGAAIVVGRYGLGAVRFLLTARQADEFDASRIPVGIRSQITAARLDGRLCVLIAENKTMPMTWGWRRPVILLPVAAADWSADRLDVVLMHELGHVLRLDALTQAIGQLVCALMWFHPLVWLAASRMRLEAEQATDDFVLAAGSRPSDYAGHLLDVARSTLAVSAWGGFCPLRVRRTRRSERLTGSAAARTSTVRGRTRRSPAGEFLLVSPRRLPCRIASFGAVRKTRPDIHLPPRAPASVIAGAVAEDSVEAQKLDPASPETGSMASTHPWAFTQSPSCGARREIVVSNSLLALLVARATAFDRQQQRYQLAR